ncbi:MAG TPA: TlpA disulfide reductase family protein [Candidatus Limnocylindrales bacterium]|nr:TlpA disulfide reductase family protein [Candidatus Limnocylindrales bacterium]
MGGKTAIALGLMAGLVAGGLIVGGVIALAPVPGAGSPSALPSAGVEASAPAPASGAPSASGPAASVAPSASTAPAEPSASTVAEAFGIGEPAPALVLPLLGGDTIDLAGLNGKPVWVNFMATWCAPCRDELPLMAGFAARYEDTGLVVLAVDIKEDEAAVQAFFQDLEIFLPVGLDVDGRAQAEWGAVALPVHFWVDADGIVRDGALGGIGPDIMAEGLGKILPGVTVAP